MGFLLNRWAVLSRFAAERARGPFPMESDPGADETLIMLDGVGGWLFAPVMFRRALAEAGERMHTVLFDWHHGMRGNLLRDLMSWRANQVVACRLARRIMDLHKKAPNRPIHLAAYSGGCGVAVFALERLRVPTVVSTVVLLAPALSPGYPLDKALRAARRMFVGVSARDRFLLGIGTRWFGTMDRVRTSSAGRIGFLGSAPPQARSADGLARGDDSDSVTPPTNKLRQLVWRPTWRRWGHAGGHTGWIHPEFLRVHLPALLRGRPDMLLLDDARRWGRA